ncbi:hypothetical protein MASR2M79_12710 [Aminivibrio sp.]
MADGFEGKPSPALIAGGIHGGLARALVEICLRLRKETGLNEAVLSGGVWQNRRLLAFTLKGLRPKDSFPCPPPSAPQRRVRLRRAGGGGAARWGTPCEKGRPPKGRPCIALFPGQALTTVLYSIPLTFESSESFLGMWMLSTKRRVPPGNA